MTDRIHTWVWVLWLAAALTSISLTRNPFYLVLILVNILLVLKTLQSRQDKSPLPFSIYRFSLILISLSALFNGVFSHFGNSELFYLPEWLPIISGAVTLEALVYGAINGIVLSGIFASFTVLNQALPVRLLVRLVPQAFYPLAVVTSIAITFVPTTIRQFHHIREAQAIRGHRLRGVRDWLPLLMPLLVGGLERAFRLAEAMTARGFSRIKGTKRKRRYEMLLILGLVVLIAGWLIRAAGILKFAGAILMVSGALLIVLMFWSLGRSIPRTYYVEENWKVQDLVVVLGVILVVCFFVLPIPGISKETLAYTPYPEVTMPNFNLGTGLGTLGLIAPAILLIFKKP